MYGLVNKAIKDFVSANFGDEKWNEICNDAGVDIGEFKVMHPYSDDITYRLVASASKALEIPAETVLTEFGRFWTVFTAQEGYGPIMDMFGSGFRDAVNNLNNLHDRLGLSMPDLKPPRFQAFDDNGNIRLLYESKREHLAPFLHGLLLGLAEKYDTEVEITHVGKDEKSGCEEFYLKVAA